LTAGGAAMGRTRRRWTAAVAWTWTLAAVRPVAAGLATALTVGLTVAGCSSGAGSVSAGGSCGATRTEANVAVAIKVTKGTVDCAAALGVEQEYAAMIRKGYVPGNGGGAPVTVDGWTCEGYPTPEVLRTGDASECHTANAEVVAVLAAPSAGT
jgi:hypothetical protein